MDKMVDGISYWDIEITEVVFSRFRQFWHGRILRRQPRRIRRVCGAASASTEHSNQSNEQKNDADDKKCP